MLAHAFLTVMAATGPDPGPDEEGLIRLTRNEIRRLFSALAEAMSACEVPHRLHGHDGDADIKHEPAPATPTDKRRNYHDHELRLEY